ncbi:MAG TPA: T9SS type A sorting domain-containing protein [Bacteroidia bacterium]|nr:T9SS type A sorting domain-containing protein [Bacteroidia bacterium]
MKKIVLTLTLAGTAVFLNAQNRVANPAVLNSSSAAFQQSLLNVKSTGISCDTMSNFILGSYTQAIYTDQGGGYVSGQNSYADISKADKYGIPMANSGIYGAIYIWGAASSSGTGQTFNAQVWDNDGSGGFPNTTLGSQVVTYDTIVYDFIAGFPTLVLFSPITVSDTVYVGVNFGYTVGDTLAIITSLDGEASVNTAYEQFSTNDWHQYSETPTSWGISVAHAIFPIVCTPTGIYEVLTRTGEIAVAPNPSSTGVFTVVVPDHDMSKPITMDVYDAHGSLVFSASQTAGKDFTYSLDLSNVAKGIYMLKVETFGGIKTQKITVN